MKKITLIVLFVGISIISYGQENLHYKINLNDRSEDTFKVSATVNKLNTADTIYQFASTAPGTYQVMNLGRFVKDFKVFDKKGKEIPVVKKSVNQYKISDPQRVKSISYEVAETWDTQVEENTIYKMAGTSLENDHALINAHCIVGFPLLRQAEPISLELTYPDEWMVGTALSKNDKGYFVATSYDHLIDSPILLGELTKASTTMGDTKIELYTYSKTGLIKSETLLNDMGEMLASAKAFLKEFPVDRYTFLFHFEDETAGAWEHSYSSEYIYEEQPYTKAYSKKLISTAAHEFFHIVTPLNIHSEIIEQFNFSNPTPSKHLWLYEGVTEWASDMMQVRSGSISLEELLTEYREKLLYNDYFDPNYSLQDLALTSFTTKGAQQYGNIYMKGAIIATLLDIRLLELSDGDQGLREVVLQLSNKYGKDKAFPENGFFNEIVQLTHPEIEDFFNDYIIKAEPLPLEEYFNKIGIIYYKIKKVENEDGKQEVTKHNFDINEEASPKQLKLRGHWLSNK